VATTSSSAASSIAISVNYLTIIALNVVVIMGLGVLVVSMRDRRTYRT
jgi:hypothetical protein